MRFKNYLNDMKEETTSGDIATVDTKLDTKLDPNRRQKHLDKGKKCKTHRIVNCEDCEDLKYQ
jgi:hypothetical protein